MTNIKKLESFFTLFKQALSGNNQQDYTKGSIGKAAFLLAVPMVLEMAMESVFAITDIFFVSGLGADAVAVVGLTEAVITLLYAVAIGLSMAVTAMVARRIGEKKYEAANIVAAQTLWVGLLVALIVGLVGLNYADNILIFMGASDNVLAVGESYTSIMLGGSITILYLFLINAIFRGAGDATIAMRSLWLANGINIVLDPLLIYGVGPFPEMGVTGAAVATNIGRGIGVLYQLYHLSGKDSRIRLGLANLKLVVGVCARLLRVSVGGILQFIIATASWVVLVRLVSSYGSAAVAGYTIAIRVIIFTILPAWGLSNAVATLVGQNLGAGEAERAEKSVWKLAKYNVYFMLSVAIIFIAFAEIIIGLFTDNQMVIQYGVDCLRYISYGYGFYAIGMIVVQAFNGAGDTMTPTKINFFCFWMCQIPMAYTFAQYFELGPTGVFLSITIAESLMTLVSVYIFRLGHWKLKTV
ncbi:MATE family efflux transporter [Aliikangiella coralliicola]|uniref:Multidrug-efflux transporter n=1 Tax=Aliikangiella coralliicola TaxID=2592383 RepID=A0A545U8I6_9GAMM|nr:MATE family efflux transporter [Aliikangiella coralliicola]TQV85779.1 MATE family efflux transporter [Aliikangiella coralliicola]